jgi:hypothetical protein
MPKKLADEDHGIKPTVSLSSATPLKKSITTNAFAMHEM